MKLITSEMDAETEKWEEPDNEIVRRAKNMSSMAFSMYLFTRLVFVYLLQNTDQTLHLLWICDCVS